MTSVTFPFFVGKPREDKTLPFEDAEFRYPTKSARQLERAAGAGISFVIARGQFVESLVLMVCYGLRWNDPKMTEDKAIDLLDQFVDAGGDARQLRDACIEALNASGVYGRKEPAEDESPDGSGKASPPPLV